MVAVGSGCFAVDMEYQVSDISREPMFAFRSLNRADMATDLAIPLMAAQGWSAVTLAGIAERGNMRRQSVAQWFGTVDALREQVAWRYARRWLRLLSEQLSPLHRVSDPTPADVARLLLPEDDDGVVYARVWLAICEAGRSEIPIAAATTFVEREQAAMLERWVPAEGLPTTRVVSALVTGLRAQMCSIEPITLAEAQASVAVLRT